MNTRETNSSSSQNLSIRSIKEGNKKFSGSKFRSNASGYGSRYSSSSKKSDSENRKSLKVPVRLIDANGHDYTPKVLLPDDKCIKDTDKDGVHIEPGSQPSFQQTQANTMSSYQCSIPHHFSLSKSQMSSGISPQSHSSTSDDLETGITTQAILYSVLDEKKTELKKLTSAELKKSINVVVRETETIWMLDIVPNAVANSSDEAPLIKKRNDIYAKMLSSRIGNDRYVKRGMNTYDNPRMTKSIQTNKVAMCSVGVNANVWDIHDCFEELQKKIDAMNEAEKDKADDVVKTAKEIANAEEQKENEEGEQTPVATNDKTETVVDTKLQEFKSTTMSTVANEYDSTSSYGDSDMFGIRASISSYTSITESSHSAEIILKSENLYNSLFLIERALNINTYKDKLGIYRNIDKSQGDSETSQNKDSISTNDSPIFSDISLPQIDILWNYSTGLLKGRNISCMAWNKQNTEILAVGYGQHDFCKQVPGMVCCWSMKNIEYPERIYYLPSGVTTIDWSSSHSNLLAVGMYDGVIYILDARKRIDTPIIQTGESSGRHVGPIREIQWVYRDTGRSEGFTEVLVSVSNDGKVTQWFIKKAFESTGDSDFHYELMTLKKISTRIPGVTRQRKADALISRFSYGSCIAFHSKDSNIYLVGTEDGHIHKCSCSYNEQYIDSFFGHTGPVYQICWSPFNPDVFLSCSSDWTIKMWQLERQQAVLNIQSTTKAIESICWSPTCSTIFACVSQGAIEVWDLQSSTLDPIIQEKNDMAEESIYTTVKFNDAGDSLAVGNHLGKVGIFKLSYLAETSQDFHLQASYLSKVIASCLASQLHS